MTFKSLLAATPGLFATTRGFGVAIFEPDAWTQRLHSLQLRKQMHPASASGGTTGDPSRFDVDRFLFPLFHKDTAGRLLTISSSQDRQGGQRLEPHKRSRASVIELL
ncbi:hypothetical protein [Rhizobium leguminosarum]